MPCFGTSTLICIWSHWWAVQQGLWTSLCVRSRMEDGASRWMDDGWSRGQWVGDRWMGGLPERKETNSFEQWLLPLSRKEMRRA